MVLCSYWANIRRWISTGFTPSAQRKRTTPRCSSMVQSCKRWSMFSHLLLPLDWRQSAVLHWLNSSTDIVYTAQCTSSSLSRLPRNLKIAFTCWFTLVHRSLWLACNVIKNIMRNEKFCIGQTDRYLRYKWNLFNSYAMFFKCVSFSE